MDKRAVIAIVICAAIFFLWILVLQPMIWPEVAQQEPDKTEEPEKNKNGKKDQPDKVEPVKPAEVAGRAAGRLTPIDNRRVFPRRTPKIEYGRYIIQFTSLGGGVERLTLKVDGADPVELLIPMEKDRPHYALRCKQAGVDLAQVDWRVKQDPSSPEKITFEYPVEGKWQVTKVFTIDKDKHIIKFLVQLKSLDGQAHDDLDIILYPFSGINHDNPYLFEEFCLGFVGLRDGDSWSVDEFDTEDVIEPEHKPTTIENSERDWFGIKNRYFAAVFIPEGETELKQIESFQLNSLTTKTFMEQDDKVNILTIVPFKELTVGKKPKTYQFTTYIGPIRTENLEEVPRGLTELYDPSGFNFIAGVILAILNFGYSFLGNYGLAILFTTVVIRIALFWLTLKSQVSMNKIQQLQPKISIIREKYKDDQQRAGQEQMKLFREHKVNPMSGCLPMLMQLPIFIGMYGVLNSAFEFRRQPFVSWISDLSMPDRLLGPWASVDILFFSIDALNLLPIIMTITWFLQSYFTPKPKDPQMKAQARMMMFMPIVFGVLCYNLASGLSFYFFANSLLSLGEMKLIKKIWIKNPDTKK